MTEIVSGIQGRIAAARPGRITVCNPSNSDERFCESFNTSERYETFTWFVNQLERDLARIATARGVPELRTILTETFGDEPVAKAIEAYATEHKAKRDAKGLQFSGASVGGGLSIVAPVTGFARVVPPHQYFGDEGAA